MHKTIEREKKLKFSIRKKPIRLIQKPTKTRDMNWTVLRLTYTTLNLNPLLFQHLRIPSSVLRRIHNNHPSLFYFIPSLCENKTSCLRTRMASGCELPQNKFEAPPMDTWKWEVEGGITKPQYRSIHVSGLCGFLNQSYWLFPYTKL